MPQIDYTHAEVQIRILVEQLMNMHALICFYKASNSKDYLRSASDWIPIIETQFKSLKDEIERINQSCA